MARTCEHTARRTAKQALVFVVPTESSDSIGYRRILFAVTGWYSVTGTDA